jgi:hypothetical protein
MVVPTHLVLAMTSTPASLDSIGTTTEPVASPAFTAIYYLAEPSNSTAYRQAVFEAADSASFDYDPDSTTAKLASVIAVELVASIAVEPFTIIVEPFAVVEEAVAVVEWA